MFHEPVLKKEAVDFLVGDPNGTYLDGTLGGGGHAKAILERLGEHGRLIGVDLDEAAIRFAAERLEKYGKKLTVQQGNFQNFAQLAGQTKIQWINGMLLDLGVSSHQIDSPERGFSFDSDARLDMRMDRSQELSAYEIVNAYSARDLTQLIKGYGEERRASTIARAIVKERETRPFATTADLKSVVSKVVPYQGRAKSLARVFQALRIAVNEELKNLTAGLGASLDYLHENGRIVVISYHSLEDRIVKNFFKHESQRCVCPPGLPVCVCGKPARLRVLTKKPVRPTDAEVRHNPRSRSAKLRAAELLG